MSDCKVEFASCKYCGTNEAVEFLKYGGKMIDFDTWAVICTLCKNESVAVYLRVDAILVWGEYHAVRENSK